MKDICILQNSQTSSISAYRRAFGYSNKSAVSGVLSTPGWLGHETCTGTKDGL